MARLVSVIAAGLILNGCSFFNSANDQTPTDEIITNVNEIRDFELTLGELFGGFTACGSRVSAIKSANSGRHDWAPTPCWTNIGWAPKGLVYGGYWVTVDDDQFSVHGVVLDSSGNIVEISANQSSAASIMVQ